MNKKYFIITPIFLGVIVLLFSSLAESCFSGENDTEPIGTQPAEQDSKVTQNEEPYVYPFGYTDTVPPLIYADGVTVKLKDGMDLSGKFIEGNITSVGTNGSTATVYRNINFSKCHFRNAYIDNIAFLDTTFRGAVFEGGNALIAGRNIDFTDVHFAVLETQRVNVSTSPSRPLGFLQREYPRISDGTTENIFVQTIPYKLKCVDSVCFFTTGVSQGHCACDLSEFVFLNIGRAPHDRNSCYRDAYFERSRLDMLSQEQLVTTKNYKDGIFIGMYFANTQKGASILPNTILRGLDLTGAVFVNSHFAVTMQGAILDDAVFVRCKFNPEAIITVEQIKTTWNYKTGHMDLIQLPPDLQKYFDDETAVKAEK